MDNSFQTSFIPKKPINSSGVSVRPPTSIFTTLSFLLLILIGLASGGLYVYKNYLIKQEEVLSASLEKVRNTFEKDTIDELELYDKRVSASQKILANHIVLSPMFSLIGNLTIPSIQYTKFDHQTTNQGFFVKLSGVASDYKSIALQADVFNSAKGRSFKNVVFSNLIRDKNNNVNFDLEFSVDPSILSYQKNLVLEQIQSKIDSANPSPVQAPAPASEGAPAIPTSAELVPQATLVPENTTDQTPANKPQ